jgi:aminoglycoside phosphotransferase (APT) family kinase protein
MSTFTDQSKQVRKGEELDILKLEDFLKRNLEGYYGPLSVEQFPSGFSNLTYLLKMGDRQMVLRRPPIGANIKSGHDMSREFTILSRLQPFYDKIPEPFLFCEDESIMGASFYIMERVEGVIMRASMPKEMVPDATKMSGIADALIETFAELHDVDYKKAGLADFGKPEGYIARQVDGWTKRYFKAKTDEIPAVESVALWLSENMPDPMPTCLIHNDFKYDNLVLDASDWKKVKAVLDWEMSTIGDPLMDLGTLLSYWVNPNDPPFMKQLNLSPTFLPGNPSRQEIVEKYAKKRGIQIESMTFYYVFGLFKLAVIAQQIYARYKKGFTKDERFAKLIEGVKACGAIANQAIVKNRLDDLF